MRIAYSPVYKYQLPEGHRFPMDKYPLLMEQLIYENTVEGFEVFEPKPLSWNAIALTHTPAFIDKLQTLTLNAKEIRKVGFPVRDDLIQRGRVIAGGTYQGAVYAIKHKNISLNIAGGTHHSFADHGEGFCIFNDFAIASNLLLSENVVKQILIVDLDVHQGNGTAHIFANEPRVFTFSVHGAKNYPVRKPPSDLDIGLPDGTTDDVYLSTLTHHLSKLIDLVQPDLICYLSGVDVLATDKLGRLSMSIAGCKRRDEIVLTACHERNIPTVVSMGGGYSPRLNDIIEAHANTFRVAKYLFDE